MIRKYAYAAAASALLVGTAAVAQEATNVSGDLTNTVVVQPVRTTLAAPTSTTRTVTTGNTTTTTTVTVVPKEPTSGAGEAAAAGERG